MIDLIRFLFPFQTSTAQWLNSLVEGTNNYFDINIYFSHIFWIFYFIPVM